MNKKKLILLIVSLIILLLFALLTRTPLWMALIKSKSHFIENNNNSRVLYEQGAEEASDKFAAFFTTAIRTIEDTHLNPFSKPFNVYVCNTQKSLGEFVAAKSLYPIRGLSLRGDVYTAPSAFNFKGLDTHRETLIHELAHLHFRTQLGFVKYRKIPSWFHEGFADYVSGAGGEGIEEQDAIDYILNSKHFIPNDESKVFGSFRRESKDLSGPMYHKQVKMFVTYLVETDSVNFSNLVIKIQDGESFSKSFNETLETDVQSKWTEFVAHLNE